MQLVLSIDTALLQTAVRVCTCYDCIYKEAPPWRLQKLATRRNNRRAAAASQHGRLAAAGRGRQGGGGGGRAARYRAVMRAARRGAGVTLLPAAQDTAPFWVTDPVTRTAPTASAACRRRRLVCAAATFPTVPSEPCDGIHMETARPVSSMVFSPSGKHLNASERFKSGVSIHV